MTVTHGLAGVDGRPGVDTLGIAGVRIAGDWVGPDGMLADAAVASGVAAARSLMADAGAPGNNGHAEGRAGKRRGSNADSQSRAVAYL